MAQAKKHKHQTIPPPESAIENSDIIERLDRALVMLERIALATEQSARDGRTPPMPIRSIPLGQVKPR